jgi:hypothetical protein
MDMIALSLPGVHLLGSYGKFYIYFIDGNVPVQGTCFVGAHMLLARSVTRKMKSLLPQGKRFPDLLISAPPQMIDRAHPPHYLSPPNV